MAEPLSIRRCRHRGNPSCLSARGISAGAILPKRVRMNIPIARSNIDSLRPEFRSMIQSRLQKRLLLLQKAWGYI